MGRAVPCPPSQALPMARRDCAPYLAVHGEHCPPFAKTSTANGRRSKYIRGREAPSALPPRPRRSSGGSPNFPRPIPTCRQSTTSNPAPTHNPVPAQRARFQPLARVVCLGLRPPHLPEGQAASEQERLPGLNRGRAPAARCRERVGTRFGSCRYIPAAQRRQAAPNTWAHKRRGVRRILPSEDWLLPPT